MRVIETRLSRRTFVAASLASGFALARPVVPAQSQNRSLKMETTIRVDSGITTLINIFTVEPENREQLIELLKEGTETWISTLAGFISANFHNSKDRRRVIIYGQWRRAEDIEAMRQNPKMGPYMQRIAALATMEAVMCEVSYVHHV
jgi:quinol monooxygenase YgiN